MSDPWDRPPAPAQGDDDENALFAGVGRVVSNWELIESELSHLFAMFIGVLYTEAAYDQYYERGKTTQARLAATRKAAERFFQKAPDQAVEGEFCGLMRRIGGFSERRHEVAHGVVRPMRWHQHGVRPGESARRFCLVPPHYQREWLDENRTPKYAYASKELVDLAQALFALAFELGTFRRRMAARAQRP
jgi:hypothetical protein